jgi:hypothetical protein
MSIFVPWLEGLQLLWYLIKGQTGSVTQRPSLPRCHGVSDSCANTAREPGTLWEALPPWTGPVSSGAEECLEPPQILETQVVPATGTLFLGQGKQGPRPAQRLCFLLLQLWSQLTEDSLLSERERFGVKLESRVRNLGRGWLRQPWPSPALPAPIALPLWLSRCPMVRTQTLLRDK